MMDIKRKFFVIGWSILSLIGIYLWEFNSSILGFSLLGFHSPRDSIFYLLYFGYFSDYPEMIFVCMLLFVIFIILWIISIVRIKKSMLFEYLIIADNLVALFMMLTIAAINKSNFNNWYALIILVIENIIGIGILILYKIKARKKLSASLCRINTN